MTYRELETKDGLRVKEKHTMRRTSILIPVELRDRIRSAATRHQTFIQDITMQALNNWLDDNGD